MTCFCIYNEYLICMHLLKNVIIWLNISHLCLQLITKTSTLNCFSINTQVIIQNRALSLACFLGLSVVLNSRFATVSEDDFALKCFFFSLFLK